MLHLEAPVDVNTNECTLRCYRGLRMAGWENAPDNGSQAFRVIKACNEIVIDGMECEHQV